MGTESEPRVAFIQSRSGAIIDSLVLATLAAISAWIFFDAGAPLLGVACFALLAFESWRYVRAGVIASSGGFTIREPHRRDRFFPIDDVERFALWGDFPRTLVGRPGALVLKNGDAIKLSSLSSAVKGSEIAPKNKVRELNRLLVQLTRS